MQKRVVLVEGHPITRAGLTHLLTRHASHAVVGEADSCPDALRVVRATAPDLVTVDVALGGPTAGLELVAELRRAYPDLAILVVSLFDEDLYGERALQAGAGGYVCKLAPVARILDAVHEVLAGRRAASRVVLERLATGPAGSSDVTPLHLSLRERTVLTLIGRGLGTRAIAERLALSVKTVETYRAQLKAKLAIDTAPELIRYAVRWVAGQPATAASASPEA